MRRVRACYVVSTVADPEGGRGPGGHGSPQTIRIQRAKISDNIVNTKYSMQTLSILSALRSISD